MTAKTQRCFFQFGLEKGSSLIEILCRMGYKYLILEKWKVKDHWKMRWLSMPSPYFSPMSFEYHLGMDLL